MDTLAKIESWPVRPTPTISQSSAKTSVTSWKDFSFFKFSKCYNSFYLLFRFKIEFGSHDVAYSEEARKIESSLSKSYSVAQCPQQKILQWPDASAIYFFGAWAALTGPHAGILDVWIGNKSRQLNRLLSTMTF